MTILFDRPSRVFVALGLVLAVAACAERELILPGEREDIRQVSLLPDPSETVIEGSRAISLPGQTTNASAPQGTGTPAFRVAHPALSASPSLLWTANIGAGDSRKKRITAAPVVGGGRIFTLDANAQVSAVSPSGQVIWSVDAKPARDREDDATGGGLAYADGALYVSLGFGEVAKLDAATGGTIWTQQLDATGSGSPTVVGNLVYLVAGDDTGWAIEADSGRIAWQISATPSVSNILGAPAPVVSDDLAIFAFGSGELIATFRRGGLRRWSASVAGQRQGRAASRIGDITGAPMIDGATLYAGNHSGRLAAFNVESGARLWTAREGALSPVFPAGDSIFAVTDRNFLVRIDRDTGATIWEAELPGFVRDRPRRRGAIFAHYGPILAGGRLIVASNDGVIRSFSPVNGALIGTVEVPGGATSEPVVAGGVLYVVSTRGQLHAFR
ncbi:PQQ-like beta-propeller repeat protein [Thalassococcus sp. S3]|uniref:PQQ-like beta-propeller repeat protein n=1 Tax=Thalassococcus sp. S3 TaxID=2017482 RepID=UPI001023F779|nr:PQQ-like beta-propeller repeat protein [Thalassococcus sp. S3]QBF33258.1 quinoprotein [Thalassococcus sp. S3]